MKVDIKKLMKYPSRASKELGVTDLSDHQDINACIEEVMTINEEANFGELPLDEPTLELKTLPSTPKYFLIQSKQNQ